MSQSSAPWLDGLDGTSTWNLKPSTTVTTRPTSVTHDASIFRQHSIRQQRRSLSGNSINSLKKSRSPLAPLHANENSSLRRQPASGEEKGLIQMDAGTIQQRSKSMSPAKTYATLEWRKRLLQGKTAYGEQTDLFGPSGLENIFDSAGKTTSETRQQLRQPLSWLNKADHTMPSSPPPWPFKESARSNPATTIAPTADSLPVPFVRSPSVAEIEHAKVDEEDSSASSDQFDLHLTDTDLHADRSLKPEQEANVNRTFGALTELEQEDFSPVFVSKHTTVNGKIDYVPLDQNDLDQIKQLQHLDEASLPATPSIKDGNLMPPQLLEESVFTDGSSRHDSEVVQDLSLSENLPTGTPEPLGRFVQVQRGGYSGIGSFKNRPLSVEQSALSLLSGLNTDAMLPPAPTPPPRVTTGSSMAKPTSKPETKTTPLKLFAAHDTFTSNRLLHRMSEFRDSDDDVNTEQAGNEPAPAAAAATTGNSHDIVEKTQRRNQSSSPRLDAPVPGSRLPRDFRADADDGSLNKRQSLGKRLRDSQSTVATGISSPVKTSTPKRRRTLHASEMVDSNRARTAGNLLQKHTHDEETEQGDFLRDHPAPTPLQSHADRQIDDSIREATEEFLIHEDQSIVENVLEAVEESLSDTDPVTMKERAEAVASEVAKYTLRVTKSAVDHNDGIRKPSVTTQDFFREAECVMEYIRSRAAQKKSLLTSVAEEAQPEEFDQSLLVPKGSTRTSNHMRISREPSWEDRPRSGWREPEQQRLQGDALNVSRVASQLRRWQEPDVIDDQDVFLVDSEPQDDQPLDDQTSEEEIVYDQQAQIRITGPSSEYDRRQDGVDSRPTSQRSAQSSTRRTDNVGTLAPDAVAHLIGSEVGGMTFDKDKQRWVRTRSPEHKKDNGFLNIHESPITSEDDPFREISDLAIDESIEKRRISSPARLTVNNIGPRPDELQSKPLTARPASFHSIQRQMSVSDTVLRPERFDSGEESDVDTNGTVERPQAIDHRIRKIIDGADRAVETEKEYITTYGGTTSSAPEADFMQRREDNSMLQPARPSIKKSVTYDETSIPLLPRSAAKAALVEQSELSFVAPLPGDRMISVSLSVSKNAAATTKEVNHVTDSSPLRNLSTLMLSDLPDFTLNDDDAQRPSEAAMARRFAQYAKAEAKDRFALVTKDLMRALTDLHPEEVYWDELEKLDVSKRSLGTLHGLDVYCNRVRSLDVSNNALTHLDGMPAGVTRLKARSNQLSSLTRFAQLHDLQYADVSANGLDSLGTFSRCTHLRELRADHNQIEDISSLVNVSLLRLRCPHNLITELQFGVNDFANLTHLDVSSNRLTSVNGLHLLNHLEWLDLSDNNALADSFKVHGSMPRLKRLYMRNCNLSKVDVSEMPNLEILDVSDNKLRSVEGLEKLCHLRVLEMRRQKLPAGVHVDVLTKLLDAQVVSLSGNVLPQLHSIVACLSIKHLDLSATGLNDIPADFGLMFANLRTLNLNQNGLKDIRPLLHLNFLQELHLAGNRLGRLRKNAAILSHLPALSMLDMRDNPVTQGYYSKLDATEGAKGMELQIREQDDIDLDRDWTDVDRRSKADEQQYVLPKASSEQDQFHVLRLDEETKLRRRVYSMLLAHSCKKMKLLDGLPFDKSSASKKDDVWAKLLALGVVRKSAAALEKVTSKEARLL